MNRNSNTINRKYREYFLPTVLIAMATNISSILNSMISANLLGSKALAAVTLMSPILQFVFSLSVLFGLGASMVIAIKKGERDESAANKVFSVLTITMVVVGILLALVLLLCGQWICPLLTKDPELLDLAKAYYMPFILCSPMMMAVLYFAYIFRTDGRPKYASAVIITTNIVILATNITYISVCGMGIEGAGYANVTGYAVGTLMCLWYFMSKRGQIRFSRKDLSGGKESFFGTLMPSLALGISGALGTMLITVKLMYLNTYIQMLAGSDGMVAYSMFSQTNIFVSMFITGASQTMIPIVGMCYGEKDYEGIRYAFKRAFWVLAIASTVIMLLVELSPEAVISLFGIKAGADMGMAIETLRITALSFPGTAISFLAMYYYTSIKHKKIAMTISISNGILFIISLTFIFSIPWGITGIWWGIVAAQICTLILIFIMAQYTMKKSEGKYRDMYLIPYTENNEVLSLSVAATKENAVSTSIYVGGFLESHGRSRDDSNRVALAVEELIIGASERSVKNDVDVDIRIMIADGEIVISVRDNGKEFNPCLDVPENPENISNFQTISAISKRVEYSNTLGFNRVLIEI